MSIIRAPRPAEKFYVLDKRISDDKRLSWAARGLLIHLLGKPDHWKVSVAALVHETAKSGKPTRRDGVYSLIRELESAGYMRSFQDRGDAGKFSRNEYSVSETPLTDGPYTDKPYTDGPLTAEPYTAETTLESNDLEQRSKEDQGLIREQGLIKTFATSSKPAGRTTPKARSTAVALEGDLIGKDKSTGIRAWDAYATAYLERYGVEPVRNARTNAQLAQLAKRLPADEICEVVCWYVRSSNAFYVRDCHGLGLLLRDCEGLRTQWATNSRMTSTEARQMDEHESTYESVRWVRANMDRLRKLRAEGKI